MHTTLRNNTWSSTPSSQGSDRSDKQVVQHSLSDGGDDSIASPKVPECDPYARCVVIGSPNMDLRTRAMTWVDGGETTVGKFSASAGGSAANVAVMLAQLDVQSHLVGRVGEDEMGQVLKQQLEALQLEKLDCSAVLEQPEGSTGVTLHLSSPRLRENEAHLVCMDADPGAAEQEVRRRLEGASCRVQGGHIVGSGLPQSL